MLQDNQKRLVKMPGRFKPHSNKRSRRLWAAGRLPLVAVLAICLLLGTWQVMAKPSTLQKVRTFKVSDIVHPCSSLLDVRSVEYL